MRAWRTALMVCAVAGGVACSDGPTSPGVQPEIINAVDNFQYQVSDVANFSGTFSYSWSNTGTSATVNQSSAVTGGTATLTIFDAAGVQVYQHPLSDNGTYNSGTGLAGSWTIRVSYAGASGTMNFRADKQ